MKRAFSFAALLSCALFLGGCALRETGPCHGYGCPWWAPTGNYVVSAPAHAPSVQSSAAITNSTPDREPNPNAGK